jgi:hypothetical protein
MKCILIILFTVSLFAMGCVEEKHDYKQCKDIEIARCELRANCQIEASEDPQDKADFDDRFPNFDLDTCIAFAEEHCGTRKLGATAFCTEVSINICVDQCVEAILNLGPDPDDPTAPGPNECDRLERGIDETLVLSECDFIQLTAEIEDNHPDAG